jgi:hypothetical protein
MRRNRIGGCKSACTAQLLKLLSACPSIMCRDYLRQGSKWVGSLHPGAGDGRAVRANPWTSLFLILVGATLSSQGGSSTANSVPLSMPWYLPGR